MIFNRRSKFLFRFYAWYHLNYNNQKVCNIFITLSNSIATLKTFKKIKIFKTFKTIKTFESLKTQDFQEF